jgi:proteasome activator subunit 4
MKFTHDINYLEPHQVIQRHAAVLGLGALVAAFPHATPPEWMRQVLAILSSEAEARNDRGAVRSAARNILAVFRLTRENTWESDRKVHSTYPFCNWRR